MAKRTAVIDIGSNSVRMVIFEKTSRFAFSLLHEAKSRVRISEGSYRHDGELQPAAIERALAALEEFVGISRAYKVRKLLCVATSAVRDAPNRSEFLRRVRRHVGIDIRVIDGTKEAYLGGVAAANLLTPLAGRTVDVGGGSTECACIDNGVVTENLSLDLGTVRLKELFFDRGDLEGAVAYIDAQLLKMPLSKEKTVVGIGGTFRALAQIMLKTRNHPVKKLHGYTFKAKHFYRLGEKILAAKDNEALGKLGVKKERYDVIRPGTLILMRFLKQVECETLVCSGVGVREGLYLTDLLRNNRHRFPANFNPSLRCLLDRHNIEPRFPAQLSALSNRLFDLLHRQLRLEPSLRPLLATAAKLAKIGASVHFYSYHKNSQYLVESGLEYGYTHREIMTVAALVRFHKSRRVSKRFYKHYETVLPPLKTLNRLTLVLSIADALLAHRPSRRDFTLRLEEDTLVVTPQEGHKLYLAREQLSHLDDVLAIRFEIPPHG